LSALQATDGDSANAGLLTEGQASADALCPLRKASSAPTPTPTHVGLPTEEQAPSGALCSFREASSTGEGGREAIEPAVVAAGPTTSVSMPLGAEPAVEAAEPVDPAMVYPMIRRAAGQLRGMTQSRLNIRGLEMPETDFEHLVEMACSKLPEALREGLPAVADLLQTMEDDFQQYAEARLSTTSGERWCNYGAGEESPESSVAVDTVNPHDRLEQCPTDPGSSQLEAFLMAHPDWRQNWRCDLCDAALGMPTDSYWTRSRGAGGEFARGSGEQILHNQYAVEEPYLEKYCAACGQFAVGNL